jgi:uncharacterized membrane protein
MAKPANRPTRIAANEPLRQLVHYTLLVGVVLSAAILSVGVVLTLVHHQPRPLAPPPPLARLTREALAGSGVAILNLGLLTLLMTPVLRVAALCLGWFYERQWLAAFIAALVLALLMVSLAMDVG